MKTKKSKPTDRIRLSAAAVLLNCHPQTLRRYVWARKIKATNEERTYLSLSPAEVEKARKLIAENARHRPKASVA
jgi:hypothetical protein